MYNNRRGLAHANIPSDNDARNTNFSLMHQKRRQNLEAQLEEKQELLKQYTNPRGIGMRGQTVPQRDVDILQQQIAQIKQQLEALNNPNAQQQAPPSPNSSSVPPSPWAQQQQQPTPHQQQHQMQQQANYGRRGQPIQPTVTPSSGLSNVGGGSVVSQPPPSNRGNASGLGTPGSVGGGFGGPQSAGGFSGRNGPGASAAGSTSVGGGQSKREVVWQRKYDLWLQRGGGSKSASAANSSRPTPAVPSLSGLGGGPVDIFQKPQNGSAASAVSSSQGFTPPTVNSQQSNPYARQQPQQHQQQATQRQQQEIKYGRRATPPTQALHQQQQQSNQPVWQQQQQQQQVMTNRSQFSQQSSQGGFGPGQQQQQQQQPQYGRRATPTNNTTRPW